MTEYALVAVGILLIVLIVLLASRVVRGAVLARGKGPSGAGPRGFISAVVAFIVLWLLLGVLAIPAAMVSWFADMWRAPSERSEGVLDYGGVIWLAALPAGLVAIVVMRAIIRAHRKRRGP